MQRCFQIEVNKISLPLQDMSAPLFISKFIKSILPRVEAAINGVS